MKIICLQENLREGLTVCERAIGKNITLPILNNILIEDDAGRIKLSATDLEIGINYWLPGKTLEKGSITCPAKILTGFINNLSNQKIELESKNSILGVKGESVQVTIPGINPEDFPIIPKVKTEDFIELSSSFFKDALAQIVNSLAAVETRPEISGVFFKNDKEGIILAATDSFRLSEKKIIEKKLKTNPDMKPQEVIIPQKTIQELIRIIGDENKPLKIFIDPTQILFDLENVQLISRLIEGQYPNYRPIIPNKFSTQITVPKIELLGAIKIAGIFSGKINDVKIKASPQKSLLEIESRSESGSNHSQVPAKISGKMEEIDFNFRYLIDGLGNIPAKEVFFGLSLKPGDENEKGPAILRGLDDSSYLHVIMPIGPSPMSTGK